MAYLILAGISTPLVLSVHSVVSFDFATSVIPGWHTTIFPPYFVAGAIFGGFAMVLTFLIPARILYPQLKDLITPKHMDRMCKIILLTGSIVGYAYMMEFFIAWYGGQSVRAMALPARPAERSEPRLEGAAHHGRAVLVGLLVHDHVATSSRRSFLVQEVPVQSLDRVTPSSCS